MQAHKDNEVYKKTKMKKILIILMLACLAGCITHVQRKEIVLNDYGDLPEFSAYMKEDVFCSLENEEDPVIVVRNSACSIPVQEVFGIGKAWGKCYSVDQTKLNSFDYTQFLPDAASKNLFHVLIGSGEIIYTPVNKEDLMVYINTAEKIIDIPIEFDLNSHTDQMLQEARLVLFKDRLDEQQIRTYTFYKLNDYGFYLYITDSIKTDNSYSETVKSFTFFQTDKFYDSSYFSQIVGF